jgi:3-hydroxyacyl-[acyl-carrier-protein] dehydratase
MADRTMNVKQIMELLPHRYPLLLVDKIVDYEPRKWIKGIKNVTMNELFFQGHFPGEPIMPGVLIIEALAQTGGVLALMSQEDQDKLAFFMTINNAKFRKPVVPGDQLLFNVTVTNYRGKIVQTHGEAFVDDTLVCEADLMFSIVDKAKEA